MAMSDREREVCRQIEAGRHELIALASDLIGFDTTARNVGEPPRQEADLQGHLADRLRSAGADIDLWEPDADAMAGRPLVPDGLDFDGRPQLVARFAGAGNGRSLLWNGHIDAVSAQPIDQWTSDPFTAEVRDGNMYGRGSCDMKGGVAAMVYAAEVLARSGVELAGDLVVATNTDEESSGAGSSAIAARGIRADAGIVTEPTGFDVWVSCRGSEYGVVSVPGRPGHAEMHHPPWQQGGPVNAIERSVTVIEALRALRADWASRAGFDHPYLSRPDAVPTMAEAGEWPVSYPSSCRLTLAVLYLPAQADADGWGSDVRREVEDWIARAAAGDDWLSEHPPAVEWWPNGVMPMEISPDEPIVSVTSEATADIGRPGRLSGLDSWYDGATFTLLAGIPAIAYGPGGLRAGGVSVAHTIDEHVPVDDLVACAQGLAVAAMRFCR